MYHQLESAIEKELDVLSRSGISGLKGINGLKGVNNILIQHLQPPEASKLPFDLKLLVIEIKRNQKLRSDSVEMNDIRRRLRDLSDDDLNLITVVLFHQDYYKPELCAILLARYKYGNCTITTDITKHIENKALKYWVKNYINWPTTIYVPNTLYTEPQSNNYIWIPLTIVAITTVCVIYYLTDKE